MQDKENAQERAILEVKEMLASLNLEEADSNRALTETEKEDKKEEGDKKKAKRVTSKKIVPKKEVKVYKTYEDFEYKDLETYAGLDCIVTSSLLAKTFPIIARKEEYVECVGASKPVKVVIPSILESLSKYEMPAHEFIIDMEINGIKYDCDLNRKLSGQMSAQVAELDDIIFTAIGKRINLDSGVEVVKFLYEEKGFTPPAYTAKGEPSTDGESLLTLAGIDPKSGLYIADNADLQYLATMAKRKDINSAHNTFVRDYIHDFVKRDGRIHPSYNLFGTSSFRITGDNPNLTQLPRPKHGYNVRACFTVEEGRIFITFDFSSAEVKILGALCKDPTLLQAIADGLDFHSYSASKIHGIPYAEFIAVLGDKKSPLRKKYKFFRQSAKAIGFGIIYGSSTNGIALGLGISKDEAQHLVDLYFKTYPKLEEYVTNSHKMAIWNRYVVTPFGQRKHEYGTDPMFKRTASYNACLRNAQNARVQSTTSTLGLITFLNLSQALKALDAKALCTVYDSIEVSVPIESGAKAIEMCFYYMTEWPVENFDFLDLPIGVEGEIGLNWGNLETVHRGITQPEVEAIISTMKAQKESLVTRV